MRRGLAFPGLRFGTIVGPLLTAPVMVGQVLPPRRIWAYARCSHGNLASLAAAPVPGVLGCPVGIGARSTKPFLDANVLVYAFSSNDPRNQKAEELLVAGGIVSVQVLNEFVTSKGPRFPSSVVERHLLDATASIAIFHRPAGNPLDQPG